MQVLNGLLCSLSTESRDSLLQGARAVRLKRNRVLYDQGERSRHLYFIETGLASIVIETSAGDHVEVGMIGNEGVVGIASVLGPVPNVARCVLQLDSSAIEVPVQNAMRCLNENPEIRMRLLEFGQAYLLTTERVAACNRVHLAPERMVRWLLMAQTFSRTGKFPFTHDFLAQMVAVQRTTISAALNTLQDDGLIEHGWGSVTIKDTEGLKLRTCSCFEVIRKLHVHLYRKSWRP